MRPISRTITFLLPLALPLLLAAACGSTDEADGNGAGASTSRGRGGSGGSKDGTGNGGSSTSKSGADGTGTGGDQGSSGTTGVGGSEGNGQPETCGNGIDDNENGFADEGCKCTPGTTQECYLGPAGKGGKGICKKGTQTCTGTKSAEFDGTAWSFCEGSVAPQAKETCDGVDNDCDGSVDNGCECADGDDLPCSTACGTGVQKCEGGKLGACSAPQPGIEVCDGEDNDCDGTADNGLSKSCKNDCGIGVQLCIGGIDTECQIIAKTAEICANNKDDNCDGQVDEPEACCDTVTCNNVCCPAGKACCAGGTCPDADGTCPPPPCDGVKCGGVCCEGADACCKGNVCPPKGGECPADCTTITCGGVCCKAGEVCNGTKCEVPPQPCDTGLVCKGECCDIGSACTAAGTCPTNCEFGGTAMIVLDRSNSMRYSLDGLGTAATAADSRWAAAVSAVTGMIDKATEVDFGLILFPGQYGPNGDGVNDSPPNYTCTTYDAKDCPLPADGNSGCVPLAKWMTDYPAGKGRGSDPPLPPDLYCSQAVTVAVSPASGSSAKVKPLINRDTTPLCFGTPIANGLTAAKAAKSSFVVLITDGDNNCGAVDSFSDTVKSMSDAGTKVFVVGINGSSATDISATGIKALNKAACAGGVPADPSQCSGKTYTGTGTAFYLSTSAAKLSSDLAAIATKLTCK
jgi:hypothetical protein